jgi:hypothetical protein
MKHQHITQCPYERKEEDIDKTKKFDKGYKKDKKYTRKKPCGQAHVGFALVLVATTCA